MDKMDKMWLVCKTWFNNKMSVQNTEKWQIRYLLSKKKIYLKNIINVKNQII